MSSEILTIDQAGLLADLLYAVRHNKKVRYYPRGAEGNAVYATITLRAFTREDGYLYPHDADIRDAFVWTSGMVEVFHPVRKLLDALSNLDGHLGIDQPIAIIEE